MKEIPLTKGKVAIVDDSDYERVAQYKWHLHSGGYAARKDWSSGKPVHVYMHRYLMNVPKGVEVDHINGDRLDNRRSINLRRATRKLNARNGKGMPETQSQFKGISLYDGYYHARVMLDGQQMYFGRFKSERAAAKVYDYAAMMLHQDFARLNFPDEPLLNEDDFLILMLPKTMSTIFYGPNAARQLESRL